MACLYSSCYVPCMADVRRGALFATYLSRRPCAPLGLSPAQNCRPLFELSGGEVSVIGHHWRRAWPYWTAHLNTDVMLSAWLKTPEAFRPPKAWPVPGLPPQVTPRVFASCILPSNEATDHGAMLYHCPHLEVLAAWAHGWPVPKRDWHQMEEAIEWLIENPVFTIWAYDLDILAVPMPFSDASLWLRLGGRARMEKDPLSVGTKSLKWSLPKELYKDIRGLMRLPRRSEGVAHSSKWPNLKPDLDSP